MGVVGHGHFDDEDPVRSVFGVLMLALATLATKVVHVRAGDSIQFAVDAARHGDTVVIARGVHTTKPVVAEYADMKISVDNPRVEIMGESSRLSTAFQHVFHSSGTSLRGFFLDNDSSAGVASFSAFIFQTSRARRTGRTRQRRRLGDDYEKMRIVICRLGAS
jgi:hypothetical protein